MSKPALIVVDMQRFYIDPASDFRRFYAPHSDPYFQNRLSTSIPATCRLLEQFRARGDLVVFLRIASSRPDRSDLHRFFTRGWQEGRVAGFDAVYPLADDPWADPVDELGRLPHEPVLTKTTFSGFNSGQPSLKDLLATSGVDTLVMAGLCTSQCVETTARDASDLGFRIILVEDALADYSQEIHDASLYSSMPVCGGMVVSASGIVEHRDAIMAAVAAEC